MSYSRYGHVNQVFVKVGDKVKAGQKIATNGTGNGQWLAHLHRDHPKEIPDGNYTFYNIGWTKEKTLETFNDPTKYPKALGERYDHLGYGWLEEATYSSGKCFHPGLDENGKGSGNTDLDDPVYAVADGTVEYVYAGNSSNGGWGRLIVVKEEVITNEEPMDEDFVKAVGELCGKDYGKSLNEGEQKDAVKKLKEVKEKVLWVEQMRVANERLMKNNEILSGKITVSDKKLDRCYDAAKGVGEKLLKSDDGWSEAYQEVLNLRDNLRIKTEKANGGLAEMTFLDLMRELKNRIIKF